MPTVWREPKNHFEDCYFCLVDLKGFNRHKKGTWNNRGLESAQRPAPHCDEVPIPEQSNLADKKYININKYHKISDINR